MTYDAAQPTLPARRDDSFTARLARLDFVDAVALDAFERARDDSAPISPALRLTFELAGRLNRAGVLRLLSHLPRQPDWLHGRALYDPIAWEFLVEPPERGVLREALAKHLREVSATGSQDEKVDLWRRLVDSEFEGYLAHLLRRHRLEPVWAKELSDRLASELQALCLAQRRALAWSGVREAAAAFLRTHGDERQAFETMASELRRQARWLIRHSPGATQWLPREGWRRPLLLTTFLALVPLGQRYWTELPRAEALP